MAATQSSSVRAVNDRPTLIRYADCVWHNPAGPSRPTSSFSMEWQASHMMCIYACTDCALRAAYGTAPVTEGWTEICVRQEIDT